MALKTTESLSLALTPTLSQGERELVFLHFLATEAGVTSGRDELQQFRM